MRPQSIDRTSSRSGRTYRSELRQEQAEQTRSRVIATAGQLFAEYGYARTTLAKIADAAGVSPETVQGHGPKAALMIAAVEYAAFGISGDENILELEIGQRLLAIDDRDEAIDHLVSSQRDLHEKSARLARALFGGAAVDPELARYMTELMAGVDRQLVRILHVIRDRGWLRDDVEFDDLVETAGVLASVDTYLRLMAREGWSASRYEAWLRRVMVETVYR